jgi:hypothetical protein
MKPYDTGPITPERLQDTQTAAGDFTQLILSEARDRNIKPEDFMVSIAQCAATVAVTFTDNVKDAEAVIDSLRGLAGDYVSIAYTLKPDGKPLQ